MPGLEECKLQEKIEIYAMYGVLNGALQDSEEGWEETR